MPWPIGGKWHNLCWAVSPIIMMSHPMGNSQWVTWLCFFARKSHQSCLIPWPTGCSEWHCFVSLSDSLINHVSSHDPQGVSDIAFFLCQAVSSMSHPVTNRQWVTVTPFYFFARQSHGSCLIQLEWCIGCEWECFISLVGSLLNHVSSNNQQGVGDISLPGSLINHLLSHNQQVVSDTTLFLCQTVLSIMSHPTCQGVSDTALFLCLINHVIPQPTGSEWYCSISLPATSPPNSKQIVSLMKSSSKQFHWLSICDQQSVSDILSSPVTFHITNRLWVRMHLFHHKISPTIIPWPWPSASG